MNTKQRIPQENSFLLHLITETEQFSARESHLGIFAFHGVVWQTETKHRIAQALSENDAVSDAVVRDGFIKDLQSPEPQYRYMLKTDMVNKGIWQALGSIDKGMTFYELGAFPL